MEVESGVGWQTSAPQVLVLDLDSMGSGEAIDPLPDMLQNVILLSLASGTSGPTLIPSLAIYAIRRNSVITVMQSTTLVPGEDTSENLISPFILFVTFSTFYATYPMLPLCYLSYFIFGKFFSKLNHINKIEKL